MGLQWSFSKLTTAPSDEAEHGKLEPVEAAGGTPAARAVTAAFEGRRDPSLIDNRPWGARLLL